jgi:hypothetical protein
VELREAKVEQLHSRLRQHHVSRLEVAVDDAGAMRGVQSRRDLHPHGQHRTDRKRSLQKPLRESLSVGQLHDEEMPSGDLLERVKGGDVRVAHRGQRLCLALKARDALLVLEELVWQDFDRNLASELRVLRPIDLSHPARAERREDLVQAETGARGERHEGRRDSIREGTVSPAACPASSGVSGAAPTSGVAFSPPTRSRPRNWLA